MTLEPCPFCGVIPIQSASFNGFHIDHINGCFLWFFRDMRNGHEADAWNTRAYKQLTVELEDK